MRSSHSLGSEEAPRPVRQMMSTMLSRSYETIFERMLAEVALATTDLDVPLVPFLSLIHI